MSKTLLKSLNEFFRRFLIFKWRVGRLLVHELCSAFFNIQLLKYEYCKIERILTYVIHGSIVLSPIVKITTKMTKVLVKVVQKMSREGNKCQQQSQLLSWKGVTIHNGLFVQKFRKKNHNFLLQIKITPIEERIHTLIG